MPRTKQPKMGKKQKKLLDAANSSKDGNLSADSISGAQVFRTAKEILKAFDEDTKAILKEFDTDMVNYEKQLDSRIKMWQKSNKEDLKNLTVQDFLNMTDKAEKYPEYARALQAVLNGTYVPPPTPSVVDGNKTGSTVLSSGISVMSSASGSQHNRFLHPHCSSTSSVRSLHSKQGAPHMGSSHRSRSAMKSVNGGPGSGMRRRSMSQPVGSVRKGHHEYGRTPIITPKVHPDTSSTVLRLPKMGENLYSLGGSPVMANALASSSTAPQALIPLRDGRMLAVLPTEMNTMDRPMDFSPDTRRKLKLLKQNLNYLIIDDEDMKPVGKR